jgi:hypothetical protein
MTIRCTDGGETAKKRGLICREPRKALVLSPGQTHEMKLAADMLADVVDAYVVADSAYSSAALIAELEGRGRTVVMGNNPTHRRREIDTHLQMSGHDPAPSLVDVGVTWSRTATATPRRSRRRSRRRQRPG